MKVPNSVGRYRQNTLSLSRLQNEGSQHTSHKVSQWVKSIKATE